MTTRTAYRLALACMYTGLIGACFVMLYLLGWLVWVIARDGHWVFAVGIASVVLLYVGASWGADLEARMKE